MKSLIPTLKKMPARYENMVFDLGATQTFPLFQVLVGGILLWLGINIRIITVDGPDIEEKEDGL